MSKARDVVVVGNGLFGSVAATLARSYGHRVTVVSNFEPLAASRSSGCVLAPSWLLSLDRAQVDIGLRVLRELYEVRDIQFKTNLVKTFKAMHINPDDIMLKPDVVGEVETVSNGKIKMKDGATFKGVVLVAAGVWSNTLVSMPAIRGLYGASVRFAGQIEEPRIHVYAPYRQAVAVNLGRKQVWMGDGTALIKKTWEKEGRERIAATLARAEDIFGLTASPRVTIGIRPYVEGHKAGYFERVSPQTWVSTGGAKNGTLLAAWQAYRFVTEALGSRL